LHFHTIIQYSNKSGALRNPARSIPPGTFAAIGVTAVFYVAFIVFFGSSMPR
jgi:amino acid transporter